MYILLQLIALCCFALLAFGNDCKQLKNDGTAAGTIAPHASDIETTFELSHKVASGRIRVPHCENCIWVVTIHQDFDGINPDFLKNNYNSFEDTSLPSVIKSNQDLINVFNTGTNYQAAAQKSWGDTKYFKGVVDDSCHLVFKMDWTPSDMFNMKYKGQNVFTQSIGVMDSVILEGTVYVNAIYPQSGDFQDGLYKIYRFPLNLRFTYEIVGSLISNANVVKQRELLISTTPLGMLEVQAILFATPDYKFGDGDCVVDKASSTLTNAYVIEQENHVDKMIVYFSSYDKMDVYTGTIAFTCPMVPKTLNTQGVEQQAKFVISIEIGQLKEISRTTTLNIDTALFLGDATNPFQQQFSGPLTSGLGHIGLVITAQGIPANSNLKLLLLTLATESYPAQTILSMDGTYAISNVFGCKVFQASSGNLFHNQAGFSVDIGALAGMKSSSVYVIAMVKVENLFARDGNAPSDEEATINTRIDLFEAALKGASHSSSNSADKLVAILIPSIAGGICLLCMFGVVAFVGLILLGSIIRKGVQAKGHNHLAEDASIPSDSDVDLRNHAV